MKAFIFIFKGTKFGTVLLILFFAFKSVKGQNPFAPFTYLAECPDSIKSRQIAHFHHRGFNKDSLINSDINNGFNEVVSRKISTSINAKTTGSVVKVRNSNKIWQYSITATGADGISISFSKLRLAPLSYFFVYNPSKTITFGPYKWNHNLPERNFVTPSIEGDSLIVELYEFSADSVQSEFIIDGIFYDYSNAKSINESDPDDPNSPDYDPSNNECARSVWCSEGIDWENERRSVVKLVIRHGNLIDSDGNKYHTLEYKIKRL